jgi:hypothetical protein
LVQFLQLREPGQREIFDRLLSDFDRYICGMTLCSQESRLHLQAILIEYGMFKRKGIELLLILNAYPKRPSHEYGIVGQFISSEFREMVATVFSQPGRALNYYVDGIIYASLVQKMAEFLAEPCVSHLPLALQLHSMALSRDTQWEERERVHLNDHTVSSMKKSAIILITGILPKAENIRELALYLRDAVLPPIPWLCDSNSERILQKPFQQVLQEYITVS